MALIEVCFSPALYHHYPQDAERTVVVTDIFRASSSICTALYAGASAIIPVADLELAKQKKREGYLVAAERNVKKTDFADFGNSPFEYTKEKVSDKTIAFTTTNGTQAINKALNASELLIGAFLNLSSVTSYCLKKPKNLMILCSGWENAFSMEDTLFAGAVVEKLSAAAEFTVKSDSSIAALELWKNAKTDLKQFLSNTEHFKRLMDNHLEKDIDYCLSIDKIPILPYYQKDKSSVSKMIL